MPLLPACILKSVYFKKWKVLERERPSGVKREWTMIKGVRRNVLHLMCDTAVVAVVVVDVYVQSGICPRERERERIGVGVRAAGHKERRHHSERATVSCSTSTPVVGSARTVTFIYMRLEERKAKNENEDMKKKLFFFE